MGLGCQLWYVSERSLYDCKCPYMNIAYIILMFLVPTISTIAFFALKFLSKPIVNLSNDANLLINKDFRKPIVSKSKMRSEDLAYVFESLRVTMKNMFIENRDMAETISGSTLKDYQRV